MMKDFIILHYQIMQPEQKPEVAEVFLLVGYLGSGKTTFIKNLLSSDSGNNAKFAVIQNQFAQEMGIQAPLITNSQGTPFSNFMELPNGCICCSAKNDLLAAMEYLVQVSNVRKIIVETNGVADPGQSIKQFWLDDNLKLPIRLHSIISIVDVHRFKDLQHEEILQKQLIFSNKIVLTHLDQSTSEELQFCEKTVQMINPSLRIFINSDPKLFSQIFKGQYFDVEDLVKIESSHNHQEIISQIFKGLIYSDVKIFQKNVGKLLWEQHQNIILRIKGLVVFEHQPFLYELQGVNEIFQLKVTLVQRKQQHSSKILIIGKNLQRQFILQTLGRLE